MAAVEAVELFRARGQLHRVGLHLNLTEGTPMSPASTIPSLVLVQNDVEPATPEHCFEQPLHLFKGKGTSVFCSKLKTATHLFFSCFSARRQQRNGRSHAFGWGTATP